ncbi:hypothetical protein BCR44DRAFT_1273884 [Catenaria anguillulae PL171]|uniref:Uncharacterized protein n=1 Tax=Catenaria anguillulae PL171 TaxID=765915 RepID=A0A1Y2H9L7_9FUNG|nr:hypothetical protein BCR44DRAFT_1273884 [Catenaria anguillulae PL171]
MRFISPCLLRSSIPSNRRNSSRVASSSRCNSLHSRFSCSLSRYSCSASAVASDARAAVSLSLARVSASSPWTWVIWAVSVILTSSVTFFSRSALLLAMSSSRVMACSVT